MKAKLSVVFGLVGLLVVVSSAEAQQGRGRGLFGRGQSLITIAANEAVQKDIGLADASKVQALATEYREGIQDEIQAIGFNFQEVQNLPEAEKNAKMDEFRTKMEAVTKKLNAQVEPKLKEAVTADQFKRLGEIKLQAAGAAALADAAVVKELGLKEDQQKKIKEIQDEAAKSQQELFASAGGNFQEIGTKIRELSEKTLAKANDVLDAGQKEKFTALKGKPFDTTQLGFGGRGRRGNN